ncbi:MAG: hypothetical protein IKZ82_07790 [Clostridia bacterium]|nr:hypothetical protein [Clostridia bacterium]
MKKLIPFIAAALALFALACAERSMPKKDGAKYKGESVQATQPPVETEAPSEPPVETEIPSAPPEEDDGTFSLDVCLYGADALSEFFAALDKSDGEFDEYLRKMEPEYPLVGESSLYGVQTREEAKAAAELLGRIPFPISPEYCFTRMRLTMYRGIYEYHIGYQRQGKGYDGIDLEWIDFSGALNGEDSGADALDRLIEGASEGFFYPIDAEGTRMTRLYGDNGIFSNYNYFHAEIDGLFMKITTWQCWYDVKSFDFGSVREALERGLIRTFDAE